jgi:hypothetical protein
MIKCFVDENCDRVLCKCCIKSVVVYQVWLVYESIVMILRANMTFKKWSISNIIGLGPHIKGGMHTGGIGKGKET